MRIITVCLIALCVLGCDDAVPDVAAVQQQLVEIEAVGQLATSDVEVTLPKVAPTQDLSAEEDKEIVSVKSALERLAVALHRQVIVSAQVSGEIHLPDQALSEKTLWHYILTTQHLAQMKIDDVFYVAPQQEIASYAVDQPAAAALSWHKVVLYHRSVSAFFELLNTSGLLVANNHGMFDEVSNTLWFQSDELMALNVQRLAAQFDQVLSQVQIEARVMFVDQDHEHELGLNFHSGVDVEARGGELSVDPVGSGVSGANVLHLVDSEMLDIELAALEKEGHGEVISRPSLLTVNRQPAFIQAGEEVPYQETSGGGASTVRFKKAVLSLEVTPVLRANGQILLDIQVTQDKPSSQSVLGVPAINTRAIKTQAVVHDGETVVLGGIYETVDGNGVRAVPGLSRLPLVGGLFKYKRKVRSKRELLIFITPQLVKKQQHEKTE